MRFRPLGDVRTTLYGNKELVRNRGTSRGASRRHVPKFTREYICTIVYEHGTSIINFCLLGILVFSPAGRTAALLSTLFLNYRVTTDRSWYHCIDLRKITASTVYVCLFTSNVMCSSHGRFVTNERISQYYVCARVIYKFVSKWR